MRSSKAALPRFWRPAIVASLDLLTAALATTPVQGPKGPPAGRPDMGGIFEALRAIVIAAAPHKTTLEPFGR